MNGTGRLSLTLYLLAIMAIGSTMVSCSDSPAAHGDPFINDVMKGAIQHELDSTIRAFQVPGAIVAVRLATGEEWITSVGQYYHIARGDTATPADTMPTDRPFRIGTITETFTATVALQLVEEGELNLNAPVSQYLPTLKMRYFSFDTITIADLLHHSSGLRSYSENWDWDRQFLKTPVEPWEFEQLVEAADSLGVLDDTLYVPPYLDSRTNYAILAHIIEEITGNSIAREVTTRIITPLGLSSTIYPDDDDLDYPADMLTGFADFTCDRYYQYASFPGRGNRFFEITRVNTAQGLGSDGMISDMEDLLDYSESLAKGLLLKPSSMNERMLNTVPMGTGGSIGTSGLGLNRIIANWIGMTGHTYGNEVAMFTRPGVATIVVMTNYESLGCAGGGAGDLFRIVTKWMFGESEPV